MADTTISQLSRQNNANTGLVVPVSDGTNTIGVPISAVLTSSGYIGTDGIQIPIGTSEQRPSTSSNILRKNSTTGYFEYFDATSTAWKNIIDSSQIYNFSGTITFNNCGATGRMGPSLFQARSTYTSQPFQSTWLNNIDLFNVEQGTQYWVVPKTGNYTITTAGAGRARQHDGQGAIIQSTHTLYAGELLRIIVGQLGLVTTYTYNCGGHGASCCSIFRRMGTNILHIPLSIGGGGAGSSNNTIRSIYSQRNGQYTNSGIPEGGFGSLWTVSYDANSGLTNFWPGGGGAGWIRDGAVGGIGASTTKKNNSGGALINNALGGFHETGMHGGFGGGGGTGRDGGASGGGGGYNGGNALAWNGNEQNDIETGGGSYTGLGASQINVGLNTGHGYVTITL